MAERKRVAVIGGGPAGLMTAETISRSGIQVDLFDAMPSVGRKFLLAGKGGMNITHAETLATFTTRYGQRSANIAPMLTRFGPEDLRNWVHGLGIDTFVGSSQRVFPTDMKAAPLLRAWLKRLREAGVQFHMRHRWLGWNEQGHLHFQTPDEEVMHTCNAVVLALGGGSWARLGSDGKWLPLLAAHGIESAPLHPANCGFHVPWSEHFRMRFAGEPVKAVVASCTDVDGVQHTKQGEFVISEHGVEGSLIYALSAMLRDRLLRHGQVTLTLDLAPGRSVERVENEVTHPRGARSLASHLQSRVGITGVKAGLLREGLSKDDFQDMKKLAVAIKSLPLTLTATRPIDEVISSAGGVRFETLNDTLMSSAMPGVFCAGEMLDWEAPTGGYLLTACFASGRLAGEGVVDWLNTSRDTDYTSPRADNSCLP